MWLIFMVEVSESIFFDEMKKLQQLKVQIEEKIYQVLGIKANVKLVEKDSLSEVEPKKVVVDRRLK